MFGAAYRIATVWGIPIKIHVSLIILLGVLALGMVAGGLDAIVTLLVLETGVFTSIALHELGHSLVAIRKGCRVREITLMFLGGAAQMESIPRRPLDEFQMAIAGPVVSFSLAIAFWLAGSYLPLEFSEWPVPFTRTAAVRCNIGQFIGVVNVGLGLFNLLPAFPMDGGRVLRAMLSPRMGRLRATFVASWLGKIFAALFALKGVWGFPGGLILVALGVFLYVAADREYRAVRYQETLQWPGSGPWAPFFIPGPPRPPKDAGDQVIVGPPPYEKGPPRRTELREDDDARFRPPPEA